MCDVLGWIERWYQGDVQLESDRDGKITIGGCKREGYVRRMGIVWKVIGFFLSLSVICFGFLLLLVVHNSEPGQSRACSFVIRMVVTRTARIVSMNSRFTEAILWQD